MHQRIELIILPFFHQRRQFGSAETGLQAGGFVHRQDWGRCLEAFKQLVMGNFRRQIALCLEVAETAVAKAEWQFSRHGIKLIQQDLF